MQTVCRNGQAGCASIVPAAVERRLQPEQDTPASGCSSHLLIFGLLLLSTLEDTDMIVLRGSVQLVMHVTSNLLTLSCRSIF